MLVPSFPALKLSQKCDESGVIPRLRISFTRVGSFLKEPFAEMAFRFSLSSGHRWSTALCFPTLLFCFRLMRSNRACAALPPWLCPSSRSPAAGSLHPIARWPLAVAGYLPGFGAGFSNSQSRFHGSPAPLRLVRPRSGVQLLRAIRQPLARGRDAARAP